MHFGVHLTIDGYGGKDEKLNNKKLILEILQELPQKLSMHILGGPEVYFAKGNDKKDPGGWSGFVVIEESHISVHTFPKRGFISADVYTCQPDLDVEFIKDYFIQAFELKELETNYIQRGTRYPLANQI